MTDYHTPVLVEEVAHWARHGRRIVDGTVGGGGHAERFLAGGATVLAVDRDPDALAAARERLGNERIMYRSGSFGDPAVGAAIAAFQPDFVLLDLGVSSHQLDADGRGFSFRPGVALDMRMQPAGPTAADLLNTADEATLRDTFREYGDERRAGRLARTLVERRARTPLVTSDDLVGAIRRALGPQTGPAEFARLFQAVRIAVNDELGTLARALPALRDALTAGGVLAVISYHSGEDRIVKDTFREWARTCRCPPGQPICTCEGRAFGRRLTNRPVVPTPEEAARNPRARSAKLRGFEVTHGGT
jgi:16S rRNA (cytosine1402-N4)-methyltransferase